ncbi:LacI family DNA-binding transcriptional regulator [Plantactinospora solaniradicis]|uniref:LacI family DNA-binding transcriptional regulator n=1 Tax=Plantactinospora solaniradicis TaxID=1723736 RepID=A0ABW1KPP4_9ACTN
MSLRAAGTRPPTIHDVAARAGVSAQTVGRYVRGFQGIRPPTREKVRAAIEELEWRPNPVARALRTSTGNRILLFVHELGESGPSNIIVAASTRAREAGYVLDVVPLDATDAEASEATLGSVDQSYVAGVLAFAPTPQLAELFDRFPFSAPVLREVNGDGFDGPRAQADLEPGTIALIEHLYELGHRQIFLINGPEQWFSSRKRRQAAVETARARGMAVVGEGFGDWSAESGHRIAQADLGAATAIIAANDEMAVGAIAALNSRGIRVPDRVSVVGFDDIRLAAYTVPALTTVRADFRASGRFAVDRLLEVIAGGPARDNELVEPAPPALIRRASAAPVRTHPRHSAPT